LRREEVLDLKLEELHHFKNLWKKTNQQKYEKLGGRGLGRKYGCVGS
jgi:hypothetical protein